MFQLGLGLGLGPCQRAYLESICHLFPDEIDQLAAGIVRVTVAGFQELEVIHDYAIQFTTAMPAGAKLLKAVHGKCECPGRFWAFSSVPHKHRYNYRQIAADNRPRAKRRGFIHFLLPQVQSVVYSSIHSDSCQYPSEEVDR